MAGLRTNPASVLAGLVVAALLSACASNSEPLAVQGPGAASSAETTQVASLDGSTQVAALGDVRYRASDVLDPDKPDPVVISDPLEGFNRAIYNFNAEFDEWILLPAVDAYEFVFPELARQGITNFFSNITEFNTAVNAVLQLKPIRLGRAVLRFAINTTLGLGGLMDIATEMGIQQIREDLGQTFGRYGVGGGPFLVLPILGPSNLRDTTGLVGEAVAYSFWDPLYFSRAERATFPALTLLKAIDKRSITGFRYYETGSAFEYDLVRFLYTKKREIDIAQ